jgi:hypothetical protein
VLESIETRARRAHPREGLPVPGEGLQVGRAGEPVQKGRLRLGGKQAIGLPLPVDLHEAGPDRGQGRSGGEMTARTGSSPAVGPDAAAQEELALLRPLGQMIRRGLGHREPRLDGQPVPPRPDQIDAAAPAEHQSQGERHQRLSGAGLARQHVQAGRQLQRRLVDHPEAGHVQFLEHDPLPDRIRLVSGGW